MKQKKPLKLVSQDERPRRENLFTTSTLRPYSARNSHHPITYAPKTYSRENLTYINHRTWLEEPVKFYQNARWSLVFPVWILFYNRNTTKSPRRFHTTGSLLPCATILRCLCGSTFRRVLLEESMTQFYLPILLESKAANLWLHWHHHPKGITTLTSLTSHHPEGICEFIDLSPPCDINILTLFPPNLAKSRTA